MLKIYSKQCYGYFVLVFFISILFSPFYYLGDQEHYRNFYQSLPGQGLFEAYSNYGSAIGSKEPIYFVLVYYLSGVLDKDLLFSVTNALLAFSVVRWMTSVKVNSIIIFFVMLTSFYLLVLFFAAERLKIAVMLFMFGVNLVGRYKGFLYALSVLAHIQMVIVIFILSVRDFNQIIYGFKRGVIPKKSFIIMVIGFAFVSVILYFLMDHISSKFVYYMQNGGVLEIYKPMLFGVLTAIFVKKNLRLEVAITAVILSGVSFFVGSDRIVIVSYAVSLFYLLKINRGLNIPVLLICFYFGLKSFYFINNVFVFGHGFSVE